MKKYSQACNEYKVESIIIKYLKLKENYIYFSKSSIKIIPKIFSILRLNTLYDNSRINYNLLKSCPYYLIKNTIICEKIKYTISFKYTRNANLFFTFNMPIQDLLIAELTKFIFGNHYTEKKDFLNDIIIRNILTTLYAETKNMFKKTEETSTSLKNIFKEDSLNINIDEKIVDEIIDIFIQNPHDDNMRKDFLNIANKMKEKYIDFDEQGIFYPVQYYFDIFDNNNNYLFEINKQKFSRSTKEVENNIREFFKVYTGEPLQKQSDFFKNGAVQFKNSISYFNPFILTKDQFKDRFIKLIVQIKKINHSEEIILNFLDGLNIIQFAIIEQQQHNLYNGIIIFDSKDKEQVHKKSFPVLLKDIIKNDIPYVNINNKLITEDFCILKTMHKHIEEHGLKGYTNIHIDNLGFKSNNVDLRNKATKILAKLLTMLNKDDESTLFNMHKKYSNILLEKLFQQGIHLKIGNKIFVRNLISYMITDDYHYKIDKKAYFNKKYQKIYFDFKKRQAQKKPVVNFMKDKFT